MLDKSIICACLLLAGTALPFGAAAGDDEVLALLSGIEWTLVPERFAALPPESFRALLRVAGDPARPPYVRERAAAALTLYPNDEVLDWFVARLGEERDAIFRRNLAQAFCNAFAELAPGEVEIALARLLADADAHLRVRSARCIAGLGTESAVERVERYREQITEEWERRALATD